MESPFKFELGAKASDRITGFEGVLTARYEFLNGCVRYTLENLRDGEIKENFFDEDRLSLVAETTEKPITQRTGGSRPMPR